MTLKTLTTAIALATTPVLADDTSYTVERLLDETQMIRIADGLDAAVDGKDWDAARGFFADTIDVDFTSLVGGEPMTIPADGLIAGWSSNLTAEKTSFHLRGNHRVTFDGPEAATLDSHGYAWNRLDRGALPENGGDPMWEVWGTYSYDFARSEDGWKITSFTFNATAERGNPFVRNTPGS
ncbi:MAG: nuclear transport factor 2 family protein [Pseudomonadota bacterium]